MVHRHFRVDYPSRPPRRVARFSLWRVCSFRIQLVNPVPPGGSISSPLSPYPRFPSLPSGREGPATTLSLASLSSSIVFCFYFERILLWGTSKDAGALHIHPKHSLGPYRSPGTHPAGQSFLRPACSNLGAQRFPFGPSLHRPPFSKQILPPQSFVDTSMHPVLQLRRVM